MSDLHLEIDGLWDYNSPAGSEMKFREALTQVDPGAEKERFLTLLTQIARALGLQRKFDEAHQVLDQVEMELEAGGTVEVRYLLERGRVFNSSKKPEAAVPLFNKAVEIGKAARADFYTVDGAAYAGYRRPARGAPGLEPDRDRLCGRIPQRTRPGMAGIFAQQHWVDVF